MKSQLLTYDQVADRYQVNPTTIWRWYTKPKYGFPKPIQVGNVTRWSLADLEAYEASFNQKRA